MTKQIPIDIFSKVPLFHGLNETECRQVAEIAQYREFAPGELIIRQGQSSQELWVLLEGKCDVVKITSEEKTPPEAVVLAILVPYGHFGEMSFFHSAPHSASVRAQTAVKLLKIIRGDYEELIQEGCRAAYKVAYNTVHCLADRLRKMDEWVAELMAKASADGHIVATPTPTGPAHEWSIFREKMLTSWTM
jgi:CRP-like cAMP-binding protein